MMRICLHTNFRIPPAPARPRQGRDDFDSLYPVKFTERDYIRAGIDLRPLLGRGFIALQDARSREECTIIFRVIGPDLPDRIRRFKLTFRPEKIHERKRPGQSHQARERRKTHDRQ